MCKIVLFFTFRYFMEKLYSIICGLRYGSMRMTYKGYITYDYSDNSWCVWVSRYDVVTNGDILMGRFYEDDNVILGSVDSSIEMANRYCEKLEKISVDVDCHGL